MFDRTRFGWAAACGAGFGTLFVAFSVTGLLPPLAWPDAWPDPTTLPSMDPATEFGRRDPETASRFFRANLVYHFAHITVFGGVIGWLQARALRSRRVQPVSWVLVTALGFASIFAFEVFRPGIVTGGHPAPLEPLLIGVGGGGIAGAYQWLYLRKQGIAATKWLGLWIAGLSSGRAIVEALSASGAPSPSAQRA